ncbi:RAP [Symbiodinium pilosum]|uniref:RAP protein n=1 Tax=Symbiodinium pilosum TaxID=2952 RepID=A0A812QQB3_SYMPI|nr:RAP [Symbiodinium pilosum]
MGISPETLALQNSVTSAAIIEEFKSDAAFKQVAERLMKEIMQRDQEDGDKLAKGIQLAVDKKVLPADVAVEPITKVSVSGKSAEQVADEIIAALGEAPSKGCVMTLQGLSGTGKGTTVDKLREKLPNAQTWSNGNLFRSITLLAVTSSEQKGCDLTEVLTPADLETFCGMLEFGKFNDKWDVKIEGLGCKHFVSEVEKTVLKESKVGKNIPTVAEVTQGEVVNFVQKALALMAAGGTNVLLEGREQTLNHIRTPHRFELVLDEPVIIGMRQAALQMGAKANDKVKAMDKADEAAVKAALEEVHAQIMELKSAHDLLDLAGEFVNEFAVFHASAALHRIAKADDHHQVKGDERLRVLASKATRELVKWDKLKKPQTMSKIVWAMAKLDLRLHKLVAKVSDEALQKLPEFEPQQPLGDFVGALRGRVSTLAPLGRANLCWAVAKLQVREASLMQELAQQTFHRGQNLANTSWAFATLRVADERFFDSVAKVVAAQCSDFAQQNISNTAWAFAKLQIKRPEMMAAISRCVQRRAAEMPAQGIANTAWSFATLNIRDDALMRGP